MQRRTLIRTANAGVFDSVYFDSFEAFSAEYSATVPEYPTEAGNKVSDAVLKSLPHFSGSGVISGMSMYADGCHSESEMLAACERLRQMYAEAKLVGLYVAGSHYISDLIIESLSIKRDNSMSRAVTIDVSFKQMKFPQATIAKFYTGEDYAYSGTTGHIAGQQEYMLGAEFGSPIAELKE